MTPEEFVDHINSLTEELQFLRKIYHFDSAANEALADLAVEKLAKATGETASEVRKELNGRIKEAYERRLSVIRSDSAEAAAHLDIRNDLRFEDQMKWFDTD